MANEERNLLQSLNNIATSISRLNPDDQDALVHIGASFEEVIQDIPEDQNRVLELLNLSLEALQIIYLKEAPDLKKLTKEVAKAVNAAGQFMITGTLYMVLDQAGRSLLKALGRDPEDWMKDTAPESPAEEAEEVVEECTPEPVAEEIVEESIPEPVAEEPTQEAIEETDLSEEEPDDEEMSLNDIATLLIQLEPTETSGLRKLQRGLVNLTGNPILTTDARVHVIRAAEKLEIMIQGRASDLNQTFSEINDAVEKAIYALDDDRLTQVSEPINTAATIEDNDEEPVIDIEDDEDEIVEPVIETRQEQAEMEEPEPEEVITQDELTSEPLPPDADPDLLGEFITECREYIEGAEAALLVLETDTEDDEAVNTVFRAFHTIKGTSAFLGLTRMSELAHKAENLLSRVRDHEIQFTGGYADLALRSIDMLKELLDNIQEALGGQPILIPAELYNLMRILQNPEAAGINGEASIASKSDSQAIDEDADEEADEPGEEEEAAEQRAPAAASREVLNEVIQTQRAQRAPAEKAVETSVRVRTDRLDRLIEMVGELVIAQSMVAQDPAVISGANIDLSRKTAHTGKIVRELQDLSMSMRMVPLKATFQKMARLVRDLAHKSGKKIEFITEGEETEIDRNMVDILNDPLVHMIRNAVDHGIEPPELRVINGKHSTGVVRLLAYHSGGSVVVEVKDNGRGLDRDKIVAKAISRGLIESDKGMSDTEIYNLIFEPGFSTADKITDVSGRGVGMDVVRKNIEMLHGRVDITSEVGKGTTFYVRLPLTLAITDGMLVQVGPERYIIPTVNIHISFQPTKESLSTVSGRGELVMLRGELMPMFRLHRLFDIEGSVEDPTKGLLVVVGDDGNRRCAILVDELLGQQQVVAKALGDGIGKIAGVSGGAILGDGRVGLILDTSEIVSLARQSTSGNGTKKQTQRSAA